MSLRPPAAPRFVTGAGDVGEDPVQWELTGAQDSEEERWLDDQRFDGEGKKRTTRGCRGGFKRPFGG